MACRNNEKLTEMTGGGGKQSPSEIKYPILPKNIVAVVGNSPVVLGQQYIFVKTVNNKDSPTTSILMGDINRLNANVKNSEDSISVMGNTNPAISNISSIDRSQIATKPISLSLDTSSVIKSLVNQNVVEAPHLELTNDVHALATSKPNKVSLLQPQILQSAPALPLKKRSLLFSDKHQSLSQNTLLSDKVFVPGPGNSFLSTSQSASRLPTDHLIPVLVSKSEKSKAVIDLNSLNIIANQSNLREEVASRNPAPQVIPSFIVNLQESPGNLKGPSRAPEMGHINTQYLKFPHLSPSAPYDKRMQAPRKINAATYHHQSRSPVLDVHRVGNRLTLVTPPSPTILSGSGQSLVIGSIASLSPQIQSQLLAANAQAVRKPFTAVNERGIGSVPNRPCRSLLSFTRPTLGTPVTKFSSQACPALKTILSSTVSSVPPTGFLSSSFPSTSTDRRNAASRMKAAEEIEDGDSDMRQCSTNIINYYTSVENYEEGRQVMVVKPVFESDCDRDDDSVGKLKFQEADANGNNTASQIIVNGSHSLDDSLQGGKQLDKTVEDSQSYDAPLNLKIQSVFSLADSVPDFESSSFDDKMRNAFETEVCHIPDGSEDSETDNQTEEETTFNLHEDKWTRVCPLSFVVLERLTPQEIEDKRVGRTKLSVRCSHHCRMRTLSYMCDLNLLNCKNPSCFKDVTSNEKTDLCTTLPLSNDNDKENKQIDSNVSPATDEKCTGVTALGLRLKTNVEDKQKDQKMLPAQLCKDNNQNKPIDKTVNSCQALDIQGSSTSKPENFTLTTEKRESDQLEEDLMSLRRRVEEKRLRMKLQKTQRIQAITFKSNKKTDGKNKKKTAPALPKSQPKQNIGKASKGSPGVAKNSNVIPAYYVMNCSASAVFNQFNFKSNPISPQSAAKSQRTISTLTYKNAQTPSLPKGKVDIPLKTVFTTLNSLAEHFKATGHVPKECQYVMSKIHKTPLVLKVNPEDLSSENLDALREALQHTSSQSKSMSQPLKSTPIDVSSSKPKSSQKTQQQQNSSSPASPSKSKSSSSLFINETEIMDAKQTFLSSMDETTSAGQKSQLTLKSSKSTSSQPLSSSSPTASSSQSISNIPLSDSVAGTVSNSCQNKAQPSTSSKSLRSLLPVNLNTCKNISTLTHFPLTSCLLPERRAKRPTEFLSEEVRAAKRRRLEQRYPLPPGVIIKCEPDTSEYELDSNWSVTSDIPTNNLSSPEMADTEMADYPMPVISQIASGSSCMISDENNGSSEETVSAVENIGDDSSPPCLDSIHSYEMDKHSDMSSPLIEVENDEEPPVLVPMLSSSFQQTTSRESNTSNEISVTGPQHHTAQVYDSGYDSVGPSSSTESLDSHSQQMLSKQPFTNMSRIQHLKEVLKMKQLQVENMLRKRSEIPEVDLNAL